ncbi:hypothetical protein TRFO_08757 [Tritrichomonas foetus]|uniref:Uncharacterized protein n=1 Tax=Tritrichomonas foetus TaxID=1144522 RepID=A0A1J4JHV1_9EUKA|nr:hypothetical protein TRFO_08757 [Tritrichomonas foetus]|eukprot:OHS98744.1 hypothetical protein TRFO_08757 [Tritrichomonas foetus]
MKYNDIKKSKKENQTNKLNDSKNIDYNSNSYEYSLSYSEYEYLSNSFKESNNNESSISDYSHSSSIINDQSPNRKSDNTPETNEAQFRNNNKSPLQSSQQKPHNQSPHHNSKHTIKENFRTSSNDKDKKQVSFDKSLNIGHKKPHHSHENRRVKSTPDNRLDESNLSEYNSEYSSDLGYDDENVDNHFNINTSHINKTPNRTSHSKLPDRSKCTSNKYMNSSDLSIEQRANHTVIGTNNFDHQANRVSPIMTRKNSISRTKPNPTKRVTLDPSTNTTHNRHNRHHRIYRLTSKNQSEKDNNNHTSFNQNNENFQNYNSFTTAPFPESLPLSPIISPSEDSHEQIISKIIPNLDEFCEKYSGNITWSVDDESDIEFLSLVEKSRFYESKYSTVEVKILDQTKKEDIDRYPNLIPVSTNLSSKHTKSYKKKVFDSYLHELHEFDNEIPTKDNAPPIYNHE